MRQIEGKAEELEHLSHQFDSYAKSVIDFCVRDVVGKAAKDRQREKQMEQDLMLEAGETVSEDLVRLLEAERFVVEGNTVLIYNDQLAESLRKIQKRKREVLLLYIHGYSLPEIGELFDITYETVKSTKSKALKEIKKINEESIY